VSLLDNLNMDRVIYIEDAIYEEDGIAVAKELLAMNAESKEDITLIVSSEGGNVYAGLKIIEAMKSISSKVNAVVLGYAYSMAANIVAMADYSEIGANSEIMIHSAHADPIFFGTEEMVQEQIEEYHALLDEVNSKLIDMTAKYTGKDRVEIEEMYKQDTYFSPEEAVAHGLINSVINIKELKAYKDNYKNFLVASKTSDSMVLKSFKKNNQKGEQEMADNTKEAVVPEVTKEDLEAIREGAKMQSEQINAMNDKLFEANLRNDMLQYNVAPAQEKYLRACKKSLSEEEYAEFLKNIPEAMKVPVQEANITAQAPESNIEEENDEPQKEKITQDEFMAKLDDIGAGKKNTAAQRKLNMLEAKKLHEKYEIVG